MSIFDGSTEACDPRGVPVNRNRVPRVAASEASLNNRTTTTAANTPSGNTATQAKQQQVVKFAPTPQFAPTQQKPLPKAALVGASSERDVNSALEEAKLQTPVTGEELKAKFQAPTKTRRIFIEGHYSLQQLAENPQLAIVSLKNPEQTFRYAGRHGGDREGSLDSAYILGAHAILVSNTGKVSLGVKISDVKGNTYPASSSQRFPLIIPAQTSTLKLDLKVHHYDHRLIDFTRLSRYGNMTLESVKRSFHPSMHADYMFVLSNSPIVDLINRNSEELRMNLADSHRIELGENSIPYYVIQTALVNDLVAMLETHVFNKMNYAKLSEFSLKIERADNRDWNDVTGLPVMNPHETDESRVYLNELNHWSVWLELDYVFVNMPSFTKGL